VDEEKKEGRNMLNGGGRETILQRERQKRCYIENQVKGGGGEIRIDEPPREIPRKEKEKCLAECHRGRCFSKGAERGLKDQKKDGKRKEERRVSQ